MTPSAEAAPDDDGAGSGVAVDATGRGATDAGAPDAASATTSAAKALSLPRNTALDGLRGLAVAAVVIYHLDLGWMQGGFLGVSLFFTISGFLITSLVLAERDHTGTLDVRRFWGRRFRRLLPAAWAGLALAIVYALAAGDADQLRKLPGDVIAALAYVANWHFILAGDAYTAGYQAPSPVLHYWSLAIEEQFYVVFPLIVALLVARKASQRGWYLVMGGLLAVSMVTTLVIYDPERTTNIYFGTVTRAAELIAGVLLALALHGWWTRRRSGAGDAPSVGESEPGASVSADADAGPHAGAGVATSTDPAAIAASRWGLHDHTATAVGALCLIATVALWFTVEVSTDWLYRGGFWLVALLSSGLLYSVVRGGALNRALAWRPLVGLGLVSYGVYVFHWPLFLWIDTAHTGLTGFALVVARLSATAVFALVSYRFLETPIRHGRVHLDARAIAGIVAALALLVGGALFAGSRATARAVDVVADARPTNPVVTQPPATVKPTGTTAAASATPLAPPKRVLILGDSIVHQAYPVIADRFAQQGIDTKVIGGPGQSLMHNQGRWLSELQAAIDSYDPDAIVLESCCGYGDNQPYLVDGKPVALDTDELWAAWTKLAGDAADIAMKDGRTVAWVLAPPASTNGYYGPIETRIGRANQIALALTETHPGLELIDWRVIAGPDGSYAESLPDGSGKLVEVRAKDGLHFAPAGMAILADLTVADVLKVWQQHGGRTATTAAGTRPGTTTGTRPGTTAVAGAAPDSGPTTEPSAAGDPGDR